MRIDVDKDAIEPFADAVIQAVEAGNAPEPPAPFDGELPEMLRALAIRPDIAEAMFDVQQILYFGGAIERDLVENLFVAVSRLNECQFCTAQHREALDRFELEAAPQTDREAAAIDYARQVTEDANRVDGDLFDRVSVHFDHEEIVELTLLVGFINLLNMFNDALGIRYEPDRPVADDD